MEQSLFHIIWIFQRDCDIILIYIKKLLLQTQSQQCLRASSKQVFIVFIIQETSKQIKSFPFIFFSREAYATFLVMI